MMLSFQDFMNSGMVNQYPAYDSSGGIDINNAYYGYVLDTINRYNSQTQDMLSSIPTGSGQVDNPFWGQGTFDYSSLSDKYGASNIAPYQYQNTNAYGDALSEHLANQLSLAENQYNQSKGIYDQIQNEYAALQPRATRPETPTTQFTWGNTPLTISSLTQGDAYGGGYSPVAKLATDKGEYYYIPSDVIMRGAKDWQGNVLYPSVNKTSIDALKSLQQIQAPDEWGNVATGAYGNAASFGDVSNQNIGYLLDPEQYKQIITSGDYLKNAAPHTGTRLSLTQDASGNPLYTGRYDHGGGDYFTWTASSDAANPYYRVGDYATPPSGSFLDSAEGWGTLASAVLPIAIAPFTGGMSLLGQTALGAGIGLGSSLLTGSDPLQGGLMGAAGGALGNIAGGMVSGAEGVSGAVDAGADAASYLPAAEAIGEIPSVWSGGGLEGILSGATSPVDLSGGVSYPAQGNYSLLEPIPEPTWGMEPVTQPTIGSLNPDIPLIGNILPPAPQPITIGSLNNIDMLQGTENWLPSEPVTGLPNEGDLGYYGQDTQGNVISDPNPAYTNPELNNQSLIDALNKLKLPAKAMISNAVGKLIGGIGAGMLGGAYTTPNYGGAKAQMPNYGGLATSNWGSATPDYGQAKNVLIQQITPQNNSSNEKMLSYYNNKDNNGLSWKDFINKPANSNMFSWLA